MRLSVQRGRPFGSEEWTAQAAKEMGLEFTLRSGGRPRRKTNIISPDAAPANAGLFV
jgi:hypothetical protein